MIKINAGQFAVALVLAGLAHAGALGWATFESDPPEDLAQPEMVILQLAALGDPDGEFQADAAAAADVAESADPLDPNQPVDPLDASLQDPAPPELDEADEQDPPPPETLEDVTEQPDQEQPPERFEPPELTQLDEQLTPPPDPELLETVEPPQIKDMTQEVDPVLEEVAVTDPLNEPPPVERPDEPLREVMPEPEVTPELVQLVDQDTVEVAEIEPMTELLPEPEIVPEPTPETPDLVELAEAAPTLDEPEVVKPPELEAMTPPPLPEPLISREDTTKAQRIDIAQTQPVRPEVAMVPVPQLDTPPPIVPPAPTQVATPRQIERVERREQARPEPTVVQPAAPAPRPPARRPAAEKQTAALAAPRGIPEGSPDQAPNASLAVYAGELHKLLNAKARRAYPRQSIRRGEEGTVPIRIHIDAAGRLLKVEVLDESGASARLIRAAVKAVETAAPFPAFNGDVGRDRSAFDVRIRYELR